jgi:hypothetical protein
VAVSVSHVEIAHGCQCRSDHFFAIIIHGKLTMVPG